MFSAFLVLCKCTTDSDLWSMEETPPSHASTERTSQQLLVSRRKYVRHSKMHKIAPNENSLVALHTRQSNPEILARRSAIFVIGLDR